MNSLARSMRVRLCALGLLAALGLGCGSTKPSSFYALKPAEAGSPLQVPNIAIMLGPFEFPGYLDRPQIVTQTAGNELEVSEYHRWAEPLGAGFRRVLTEDVGNLLQGARVISYPADLKWKLKYHVMGRASRFDVDESGEAVLDIRWFVEDFERRLVQGPKRSRYSAQASSPRNYEAVTRALNVTVNLFAQEIAGVVAKLPN